MKHLNSTPTLNLYLDELQAHGRYIYYKQDALKALKINDSALRVSTYRLAHKGRLVQPKRGFFLIIPLEYREMGCLPATWFIDALMRFLEQPYYVGLLSAAALHGAAHQQPQVFQVITNKIIKPIRIGRIHVIFIYKKKWPETSLLQSIQTETGHMLVSNPAMTAFDCVRYYKHAGYFNNIITVVEELVESISVASLIEATKHFELATIQRLGYLLEKIECAELAQTLEKYLSDKKLQYIQFIPGGKHPLVEKSERWHLEINEIIESDL